MESAARGRLISKQKRPAAVARFLNMIPLDDRHAAMNMLLSLGLRAYKQSVAAAPADVHTLRFVVAAEAERSAADMCGRQPLEGAETLPFELKNRLGDASADPPLESGNECGKGSAPRPDSCSGGASVGEHPHCHTPALCFILKHAFENPPGRRLSGANGGGSACFTAPMGDFFSEASLALTGSDELRNHDLFSRNVSDGTGDKQSSAVSAAHHNNGFVYGASALPLLGEYHCYPMEFVHHVMRHIETTRGVRENAILVAASLPQSLAIFTFQSNFDDLYRSLLVSYHLSVRETDKNTSCGLGN